MSVREPIAIVGMGCRFPGGADSPDAFWNLLRGGVDAITEVPADRWNASRFHHPNPAAPGRMVTRWGGFVDNVDTFDAAFFGIAPREAACIDPQHRWLMETTWEAIEDAGLPPEQLAESRTAVFVGISHSDYPTLHRRDTVSIDGYTNIGSALSIAANRISYLLNLRGPSVAVDTACSSSLVALHLAAQNLWSGECDQALVGGANALLLPESSIGLSQARMLSPRGRCRAFSADADGYVRAEGAASILLMPLAAARARGIHVRALLLATASNQDGHSSSLTVPNQRAQEEMIRLALQTAGARPRDVVYVEAHGTGTPVGDPIEARALASVLSEGRQPNEPLLIGSVKTNIGHLESASGMAGVIKAVLILEQRAIPPSLHFATPNPLLPADRVKVPVTHTPLPSWEDREPLIAVNSFGFGGSNAHAVLAPVPSPPEPTVRDTNEPCIFPLSARSSPALTSYADAFARFMEASVPSSYSLRDLCAAAALGKSHHSIRQAFVADSMANLQTQLLTFAKSTVDSASATAPPKIAFVFSGQGPQWWAMGRQLFRSEKTVREFWERCDAICQKLEGLKLLDALLADEASSRLNYTDVAQPALFTLQAGLVELWRQWGVEADAVIGHSSGEATAAWAAGIFSLEEILRIILARSRWMVKTHGLGRMLAASIPENEARRWERKFPGRISVAGFNAPGQVTLSGEAGALEEVANALREAAIFHRFLRADYAFHSAQMDAIERGLRKDLAGLSGKMESVSMISTVTGAPVKGPAIDEDYWWRNVREPVRFSEGIAYLLREGCTALVEIGPHPVMAAALAEIVLAHQSAAFSVASSRRGEDERKTMLQALATLYRNGARVRWEQIYSRPVRAMRLPTYPWQRQRLWHEFSGAARELRSAPAHPLLGDRQPLPQPTWLNNLDVRLVPWLADHRITGSPVMPAAAYLEMAAAAVRELTNESIIFLEDIKFHHLLFLPDERPVPTCVKVDPAAGSFQIFAARPNTPAQWEMQAEGLFRSGRLHVPPPVDLGRIREECKDERDPQTLYRELSEMGQVYGPAFQGLTVLHTRGDEAVLSLIAPPGERGWPDYLLFPPALDSCFHSGTALRREHETGAFIIMSLRQVQLFQPLPEKVWSHLQLIERSENSYVGHVMLYDSNGAVVARVEGVTVRRARSIETDSRLGENEGEYYEFAWEAAEPKPEWHAPATGEVLVFADREEVGLSLGESLRKKQISTRFVFADAKLPKSNGTEIGVDLRQENWAIELWENLAARGPLPARVLYLWNSDSENACALFLALTQARLAYAGSEEARWLVVTRHAQAVYDKENIRPMAAALWGFVRTVQTERPQWRISLIDCDDYSLSDALLEELFGVEIEPEIALREDGRWVRRLRQLQPKGSPHLMPSPAYALEVEQPGRVDSLRFSGRPRLAPKAGQIEVEVVAAGLNFRDLMKVLRFYPLGEGELPTLGDEFSGRVARLGRGVRRFRVGDRVAGFAPAGGAFGSHLNANVEDVWKIPPPLCFPEAASILVAFGTAYHALHTLAQLRRGETILIHAAAGGVGLAAVQLAQKIGAIVLATAGSEEKRAYLSSLGVSLVMDSRTLDFADEVLKYTKSGGVDVVLNSLAGPFQQKSLSVCARHGRFIEIGKRDLFENNALPLGEFKRSLSFFTFDLNTALTSRPAEQRPLRRFLASGFTRGKLKPIPCTRFAAKDAVSAFRHMQGAQHIGKIVLEFDPENRPQVPAEFWPKPEGTYLITGGLNGFGLATANWLAERGARNLALVSRRGASSPKDARLIDELRSSGVSIFTQSIDVADSRALAAGLRRLKKMAPPLRGIFHAAAVFRDRPLAEMTQDDLAAVLAPKVKGAWNLHEQTREMPLDCFVLFSSLSSIIGAPGQANYAAANAFLDALAHSRHAQGLPALSINWGQISDVGTVADRPEVGRFLNEIGVRALSSQEALRSLSKLIAGREPQVGVMDVDWEKLTRVSVKFNDSPIFRDLVEAGKSKQVQAGAQNDWRATVRRLPQEEQGAAVFDLVVGQLAATLGLAAAEIDRNERLNGMDSLMAVELKVRLESHAGCALPIDLFNAEVTSAELADRLLQQMNEAAAEQESKVVMPARAATAAVEIAAPLLRKTDTPLLDLVRGGKMERLTAAALMSWPDSLFEQSGVPSDFFFQHLNGGRVLCDLIFETSLGSVGIFMLPMRTSEVMPGARNLLSHVLDGVKEASECGAKCVALTGLIATATNYGAAVQAACSGNGSTFLTTGHNTTIAAVILNLEALLDEAGREMKAETVMFYGIGSIGLGALRLMLEVLPHPAELHLCDPFRSADFFAQLETTLREEHRFEGAIRLLGANFRECYDATVIVGATNTANVLEVDRLAPGTLMVDDSAPHCLNGPAVLARLRQEHDILCTEGGFVRSEKPMPRITHVPEGVGQILPAELPELFLSFLTPHDITACILSALLSARYADLSPTIGLTTPAAARAHWNILPELGFTAADLNYEGTPLDPEDVALFRNRFSKAAMSKGFAPAL